MRNYLWTAFVSGMLLQHGSLLALQSYPLIDQKQTHLKISSQELNRIAVIGDRIQQIFGAEGSFDVQSDESSGQIFVRLLDPALKHSTTLTLITESGLTHDCTLIPEEIPFQSILFTPGVASGGSTHSGGCSKGGTEEFSQLIQAMRLGSPRPGYQMCKLSTFDRSYPAPLKITPQVLYQGDFEGRHYILTNEGGTDVSLSEKALALPQDKAIALGKRRLGPGESCAFFVVSQRRDS